METDTSPSLLVFDVNETLLDITTLEPLFERLFGDRAIMRQWFAELILYSQTLTLSGRHIPFGELAVGVLRMVASIHRQSVSDSDIDELKSRLGQMPALPDARPALRRLQAAGYRLVTLTNSPPTPSPTPLERAGLAEFFERHFSVESVGRYKPAPETYRHVAQETGTELPELCLIACHLWDTIGAQAAGCRGALVTRPNNAVLPAEDVPQPNLIAADLDQLVTKILERWPRS